MLTVLHAAAAVESMRQRHVSKAHVTSPCGGSPFLEIPESEWVCANGLCFAIFDSFPVTPGQVLVITRRVVPTYFECTAAEQLQRRGRRWPLRAACACVSDPAVRRRRGRPLWRCAARHDMKRNVPRGRQPTTSEILGCGCQSVWTGPSGSGSPSDSQWRAIPCANTNLRF